ncbi:response regulator [Streptomyces hokutonensis]|uniref:response regulator n=1 Tax=Streptomyces hokutonensis TaxID=1306990 RepID=UPI003680C59B
MTAAGVESARHVERSDPVGGVEVVGIASTGADAVSRARETAPDVVLVDLDLDGENGFDVARRLAGDVPAVILFSTHSREDFQELIAASPARGFLDKSSLSARAIRDVLSDGDPAPPP